jgi:hypothetical protein
MRKIPVAGDVDHVDAHVLEQAGEGDRVREIPAVLDVFAGGDADEHEEVRRERLADGASDVDGELGARLEGAVVLVGAEVGVWREELVEEIAVGGVYLDRLEAGTGGALGG